MRRLASALLLLLVAGCVRPSAVTETASDIQRRVTPAAREIAEGSQRLVRRAGRAADDATLAARLGGILRSRRGLDGEMIKVTVRNGVVRLRGSVPTAGQKRLAASIARETVGVKGVTNGLTVRRTDERSNVSAG